MVLPPPPPATFFHSREHTNLRLHSRDILSINSPSQRAAGGGTLIVYVRVRETGRETVLFNKFGINYASCSHANPAIYNSSVWISDAFITMSNCASVWEILQSLCRTSIVSVSLSLGKMSTASHLLLFLSMLARVSVRIHHASLGVDQGENTSLSLPTLPPPAPLALI